MPSSTARVAVGDIRSRSWRSPSMVASGASRFSGWVSSGGAPSSRCWKRRSHLTSGHSETTWRMTTMMPITSTPTMTPFRIGVFMNTRSRSSCST